MYSLQSSQQPPAKLSKGQLCFCLTSELGMRQTHTDTPPAWATPACTDEVIIVASCLVKIIANMLFFHFMSHC